MKFVLGGIILLLLVIMIAPQLNLQWNILGALLIVAFGFLFVRSPPVLRRGWLLF